MRDSYGRKIDYLRLSVTDRCNLRCFYCMPPEGIQVKPSSQILSYEELTLITKVAAKCRLKKVRLTGGEPLVRKDIEKLASYIISIPGIKGISLTTNGYLLEERAKQLKEAGIGRVNISIDTLNPEHYKHLTRGGDLKRVLRGVDAALEAKLTPVKINVVALREFKDGFEDFVNLIYEKPVHVRFIEYMPIGKNSELSENSFISIDEIKEIILKSGRMLIEGEPPSGWGPAKYYTMAGALGTIGFIAAESTHFCDACNRLRITASGKLKTCLFDSSDIDIKPIIRGENAEEKLEQVFIAAMDAKPKVRSHRRSQEIMSKIGG